MRSVNAFSVTNEPASVLVRFESRVQDADVPSRSLVDLPLYDRLPPYDSESGPAWSQANDTQQAAGRGGASRIFGSASV
jgi:hypothetical protein